MLRNSSTETLVGPFATTNHQISQAHEVQLLLRGLEISPFWVSRAQIFSKSYPEGPQKVKGEHGQTTTGKSTQLSHCSASSNRDGEMALIAAASISNVTWGDLTRNTRTSWAPTDISNTLWGRNGLVPAVWITDGREKVLAAHNNSKFHQLMLNIVKSIRGILLERLETLRVPSSLLRLQGININMIQPAFKRRKASVSEPDAQSRPLRL